jgi:hypothetical protein
MKATDTERQPNDPTEEQIAYRAAVIRTKWDDTTMFLRLHGITVIPKNRTAEGMLKQLQKKLVTPPNRCALIVSRQKVDWKYHGGFGSHTVGRPMRFEAITEPHVDFINQWIDACKLSIR